MKVGDYVTDGVRVGRIIDVGKSYIGVKTTFTNGLYESHWNMWLASPVQIAKYRAEHES